MLCTSRFAVYKSLCHSLSFPTPCCLLVRTMEVTECTRIAIPQPQMMGNQKRVTISNFDALYDALGTTGPELCLFLHNELKSDCRFDGRNRLDVRGHRPARSIEPAILSFARTKLLCVLCASPAKFYYTDQRLLICGRCGPQRIP